MLPETKAGSAQRTHISKEPREILAFERLQLSYTIKQAHVGELEQCLLPREHGSGSRQDAAIW